MKNWQTLPFAVAALVMPAQALTAPSAPTPSPNPAANLANPFQEVENSTKAINYGRLKGSIAMGFQGTKLMPDARGVAKVKSKPGGTFIKASFEKMAPASSFGGEFLTYVLWGISTEGRATNLGELRIHEGEGKIKATDALQTFAMVVTAEPYFAVTQPSDVVVMENVVSAEASTQVEIIDTKYQLQKRDQYALNMDPTAPVVMDKKTPFEVYQARNAVRIAQGAGAPAYSKVAFEKAQTDLVKAETESASKKSRIMDARASVQSAEDARMAAVKQQRIELAARNQQMAQDQVDAAQAAQVAALQQAATAEAQKNVAEIQKDVALDQKDQALNQKDEAVRQADAAKANVADLQAELMAQFGAVLQTRATARGLIVNMSGVLFQNGKATVLPAGREKLAKIAGILATHKGLKVEADGFTDSTGTAAFNQRLSEQRAENARNYLVSQGVAAEAISAKGFGPENPIASNSNASGRQENRRVELVVSGEGLTSPKGSTM
jgi:outer membrane protein OmpA-like peptidoglycan-associated protein